jgi:hypothetical protein
MAEHATQAVIGWGAQLSRGNGDGPPETFTAITELTAFEPPDEQADDVEVTHFESPDRTKEYVRGMIDAGEASFTVNYNPAVYPSHQQIVADKASGAISNWKFVFPDDMETDVFPAYVKGFKPKLGPNDALTADVTLKVAGAVVRTLPEIS